MKNLTIRSTITWLKHHPRKRFTYLNEGCGCLFTRILRDKKLISSVSLVTRGGHTITENNYPKSLNVCVPFHDAFWDKRRKYTVTSEQAIVLLKKLQKEGVK